MIRSMTAFARQEHQEPWGQVCWELRSVNHRYLDVSIRLPDEFRHLEELIRERIHGSLKRGKINVTLYFATNSSYAGQWQLNETLVKRLWETLQNIQVLTGNATFPNNLDILRWPGVLEADTSNMEQMSKSVLQHFDTALAQLLAHREREGAQLTTLISQRCTAIAGEVAYVRHELPTILQLQRERLQMRLAELANNLNNERIEQEMVISAQKIDVAEELERLEAHLVEIRQVLIQEQPAGRHLDFLVQELHREANTLGTKSAHINTSRRAVELKVLIEQMREQIQNIE